MNLFPKKCVSSTVLNWKAHYCDAQPKCHTHCKSEPCSTNRTFWCRMKVESISYPYTYDWLYERNFEYHKNIPIYH